MKHLVQLVMVVAWIAGIILAKGFWSTLAAVIILPYSWYLVIEKVMILAGWI